jgi:1,3-beta-glucan synthase
MNMPSPMPVHAMPVLTVLTPHFSEKILLSLRELIKDVDGDQGTDMTLLDYLKFMHSEEWQNFVTESERLAMATSVVNDSTDNLALKALGFRSNNERDILRTRIWASLRSQTLFVC